jgi:hypothetical protein
MLAMRGRQSGPGEAEILGIINQQLALAVGMQINDLGLYRGCSRHRQQSIHIQSEAVLLYYLACHRTDRQGTLPQLNRQNATEYQKSNVTFK